MKIKIIRNKKSYILPLLVIIFSAVSVFGLSLITGNKDQSFVGNSSASAQEPADINSDNKVDVFDLSILLSKWGTNNTTSDLNKDGTTNVFDLSMLLSKWGVVNSPQCVVSDLLVNTCRPWLGATAARYPNIGDVGGYDYMVQMNYFNKRLNDAAAVNNPNKTVIINKKPDFVHLYKTGNFTLNTYDKSIINSSDQYLQLNWKPSTNFYDADGSNSSVNATIDAVANNIKSVSPKKIMLVVYHEPENDVTTGSAGACSTKSGQAKGTPTDYVNMWKNVRQRFDNLGVNNVVWAVNYMGFSTWDCMVPLLWPGNDLVDWILWDPYDGGAVDYIGEIKRFYTWMENNSDATHNYTSKVWGLGEFGYWNDSGTSTDANSVVFWQQAKQALISNSMPRLKLYSVYDTTASSPLDYSKGSFVGLQFNATPTPDMTKQASFNDFANTILNTGN